MFRVAPKNPTEFTSGINKDFFDLYRQHWVSFFKYLDRPNTKLSNPLLLCFPRKYHQQPCKLFIIGQGSSNYGWYDTFQPTVKEDSIIQLMYIYRDYFRLGIPVDVRPLAEKSPFWAVTRKLEKLLNIEEGQILWSNLNKVDRNKEQPRGFESEIVKNFPVLEQEVIISKADIVIFFSGPNYDQNIADNFPGATFEAVKSLDKKQFARVKHKSLPVQTFRTYHPRYLMHKKLVETTLNYITSHRTVVP